MNRLPANQKHQPHGKRWQRYEKPQPGHRLQLDVKFLERIPGTRRRLYQFTAIDDCTRIRVLKVYDACNQRTAIHFIDEVRRGACRFACTSCRPTTVPSSSRNSTGISRRGHPARLHPPTDAAPQRQGRALASRRRPGVLPAARQGRHHATTSTCSMRSCVSGRTTTITIARTGRWAAKPRTSDCWQKRELKCHQGLRTLQIRLGGAARI